MKAKLLLTLIFLISFLENTRSQEYHPFLDNSSWVVSDWVSCCRPPMVKVIPEGADAPIGEFAYKKFIDPFPYGGMDTVYIREDIFERKVYRHNDDGDILIYDFSLEDGDSITLTGYSVGPIEFTAEVDDCSVMEGTRKRITLTSVGTYSGHHFTQVWIEGVGTTAHPFYPGRNMYNVLSAGGGIVYTTRCQFQNQEHVYGNPDNCLQFLSNPTAGSLDRSVTFSPNPFTSELNISSGIDFQDATFRLYNLQGQLVREIKNINGTGVKIQRNNLSSGLYLAQLLQGEETIVAEKVMVD